MNREDICHIGSFPPTRTSFLLRRYYGVYTTNYYRWYKESADGIKGIYRILVSVT